MVLKVIKQLATKVTELLFPRKNLKGRGQKQSSQADMDCRLPWAVYIQRVCQATNKVLWLANAQMLFLGLCPQLSNPENDCFDTFLRQFLAQTVEALFKFSKTWCYPNKQVSTRKPTTQTIKITSDFLIALVLCTSQQQVHSSSP